MIILYWKIFLIYFRKYSSWICNHFPSINKLFMYRKPKDKGKTQWKLQKEESGFRDKVDFYSFPCLCRACLGLSKRTNKWQRGHIPEPPTSAQVQPPISLLKSSESFRTPKEPAPSTWHNLVCSGMPKALDLLDFW